MFQDVSSQRRAIVRERGTTEWDAARLTFSRPLRESLGKLTRRREGTRAALGRAFSFARLGIGGRRETAVAAVAAHAIFELFDALVNGRLDYFRSMREFSPTQPTTGLVHALTRAARGQNANFRLRQLVANEASSRLGRMAPDARLLRVVTRQLDRFRVIANEAMRLALNHGEWSSTAPLVTGSWALVRTTGHELVGVVGATSA